MPIDVVRIFPWKQFCDLQAWIFSVIHLFVIILQKTALFQMQTCCTGSPRINHCYFILCAVCTLGHERFKNICLLSKIGKKMLVKIRMLVCINQSLSLILCVYPTKTLHRYVGHCPLQANSIISILFLFLLCSSYTHMFRCPWPTMFNHLVQELTGAEPPKFLLFLGNG